MGKRSTTRSPRPKGHDFGIEFKTAIVSDPQFVELLSRAQISACVHGYNWCKALDAELPLVSLMGANEAPLVAAFEEFRRWSEESGNDAVDLTFVFLERGGYVLGIGQRNESTQRRLGQASRDQDTLWIGTTWIKKFDTRSAIVDQLRHRLTSSLIAPFLFAGLTYQAMGPPSHIEPSLMKRLPGVPDLLKFYANFIDEKDVEENTQEMMVLRGGTNAEDRRPPDTNHSFKPFIARTTARDYFRHRKRTLERNFPVTLGRLTKLNRCRDILAEAEVLGIRPWQAHQAICNLLLSMILSPGSLHYEPIRHGHLKKQIADALAVRLEWADASEALEVQITLSSFTEQVKLDVVALLADRNCTPVSMNLKDLQNQIAAQGLRDPVDE